MLAEVLSQHNAQGRQGLIQVLQEAQNIYGYLPLDVQREIAFGLGVRWLRFMALFLSILSFPPNPRENI